MSIIARHQTPRGEVVLTQRDAASGASILEIVVDGVFLMSSANGGSERALARHCLEPLHQRQALRVLVGGLGMGLTLSSALDHQNVVLVDVVEVEPLIVDWARTHFIRLNDDALSDERVNIIVTDITEYATSCPTTYDVILLDVDNGPTWLVAETNAVLYEAPTLEQLHSLLKPGGVLGVWASHRASAFEETLRQAFPGHSMVEEIVVPESIEGRNLDFYLYRAQRQATD